MIIFLCLICFFYIYAQMQGFREEMHFLSFMQKLKMAAKNGGRMIFERRSQFTLQIP